MFDAGYFHMTRPELHELVLQGNSDAQAELDRRTAKKASKQSRLAPVSPQGRFAMLREIGEELPVTQALRDRFLALVDECEADSKLPGAGSVTER